MAGDTRKTHLSAADEEHIHSGRVIDADGVEWIPVAFAFGDSESGQETQFRALSRWERDRFIVNDLTIHVEHENGIEPVDLIEAAKMVDVAFRYLASSLMALPADVPLEELAGSNVEYDENAQWKRHLEAVVPRKAGEKRPEWIARVWREYYEPSGRTLRDLAAVLGLAYKSVRNYASMNDPEKG